MLRLTSAGWVSRAARVAIRSGACATGTRAPPFVVRVRRGRFTSPDAHERKSQAFEETVMKRRGFVVSSALGVLGLGARRFELGAEPRPTAGESGSRDAAGAATRRILIAGGGFGTVFIKYMAQLTGKPRPKVLYLPTAAADRPGNFMAACEGLDVEPSIQNSFISSYRQDRTWAEVLLSVDAIICSGGNTLNQQAIWKAQGIDVVLRQAWDRGIVLGGASAGSLCWFEEGTTDSRPKELSIVQCLGLLKGSHSPHYDREAQRRPLYLEMVGSGRLKPGYACYNDAGIYFEDNEVKRVVKTRADARVFHVRAVDGKAVEEELPAELIS
jgi:dipeptidase E